MSAPDATPARVDPWPDALNGECTRRVSHRACREWISLVHAFDRVLDITRKHFTDEQSKELPPC
jgi:hypothetical protein